MLVVALIHEVACNVLVCNFRVCFPRRDRSIHYGFPSRYVLLSCHVCASNVAAQFLLVVVNEILFLGSNVESEEEPGTLRPSCPFGSACYRRNPQHRIDQAHPGDADYKVLIVHLNLVVDNNC